MVVGTTNSQKLQNEEKEAEIEFAKLGPILAKYARKWSAIWVGSDISSSSTLNVVGKLLLLSFLFFFFRGGGGEKTYKICAKTVTPYNGTALVASIDWRWCWWWWWWSDIKWIIESHTKELYLILIFFLFFLMRLRILIS